MVNRIKNPHKRCGYYPWVGKSPWSRKWQPTPVFLPGKPKGRGAWQATVHEVAESDTTERMSMYSDIEHSDCSYGSHENGLLRSLTA